MSDERKKARETATLQHAPYRIFIHQKKIVSAILALKPPKNVKELRV